MLSKVGVSCCRLGRCTLVSARLEVLGNCLSYRFGKVNRERTHMRRPELAGRVSGSTGSPRDQLQVVDRDRHAFQATAVTGANELRKGTRLCSMLRLLGVCSCLRLTPTVSLQFRDEAALREAAA